LINTIRDYWKKSKNSREISLETEEDVSNQHNNISYNPSGGANNIIYRHVDQNDGCNPENELMAKFSAAVVQETLQTLPDDWQDIFLLHI
jgi:DNA-directed RNA polymerase specialized sigma24 family protein